MPATNPVAQIYINEENIETIVCANNFFSSTIPEIKNGAELQIYLMNCRGITIAQKVYDLNYNGSKSFSAKEILKEANTKSKIGLVCCSIKPKTGQNVEEIYKKSGQCVSHFFVLYKDLQNNSIGLVHPQSTLKGKPARFSSWRSNQMLNLNGLKKLRIYQANHSENKAEIVYSLFDYHSGAEIDKKKLSIEKFSADFIDFEVEKYVSYAYLQTNSLPVGNGKPLIMRVFKDDKWTIIHG